MKSAVNGERPVRARFNTLWADAGAENEIADTKLFGFVVSFAEIVIEPAPVEIETLVPAVSVESV